MKIFSPTYVLIAFCALWVIALCLVCGDIMRESDQANLLLGAMKLADNPEVQQNFHNYSGQFGSYWLLAWLQQPFNFSEVTEYVRWANGITFGVFIIGLFVFLFNGLRGGLLGKSWLRVLLVITALTTPTVILSASLLASNVLAGGVILLLAGLSRWWSRERNLVGVVVGAILVFTTVCLRKDGAFLLPLLCLTPLEELRFTKLWKRAYFWTFIGASILAVLVGYMVSPRQYFPSLVLDWKLIGCYAFFGLLGGGGGILWGVLRGLKDSKDIFSTIVFVVAVLFPVLMYLLVLYSPRHLFIAGLTPLLLANTVWFLREERKRFIRVDLLLCTGVAMNLLWLGIAPKIQGDGRIKVGVKNGTCYPTADGLWPTGGGIHFLSCLAKAQKEKHAVDHNQEIWNAWIAMDQGILQEPVEVVIPASLKSYGDFWRYFYERGSYKEGYPQVTLHTDREWTGVGVRKHNGNFKKRFEEDYSYNLENVFGATTGRLVFSFPHYKSRTLKKEELIFYMDRKKLIELHPKVEFISCKKIDKHDGYIYEQIGDNLYRSNYPAIILKYFK